MPWDNETSAQSSTTSNGSHNFPRAVAHGPLKYQEHHLRPLYQAINNTYGVTAVICHQQDDPTSLPCGSQSQLTAVPVSLSHLHLSTNVWLTSTWHQCRLLDIALTMNLPDIKPAWNNDKEVMQLFLQAGFQDQDLQWLKHCCLFLQEFDLLDICTGGGTMIDHKCFEGKNYFY